MHYHQTHVNCKKTFSTFSVYLMAENVHSRSILLQPEFHVGTFFKFEFEN